MKASNQSKKVVQKLYLAFYGRAGDPDGVEYWAEQLDAAGGDLSAIIEAFANSIEFQDEFGRLTTEELVDNLFDQLFGHDADDAGRDFYVELLESGQTSLAQVAVDILNGAQNEDSETINNRLEIVETFTLQMRLQNKAFNGTASASVKAMLRGVGSSRG